jgi:dephospho-CoA kinase
VGLTGGIATGKTFVRRCLEAAGLPTLDLDLVTHALLAPGGAAHAPVAAAFGPDVLDAAGAIDRKALGRRVFGDAAARARLEAVVHPLVREQERGWVEQMRAEGRTLVVVDAALLVEAGLHARFDRLVVTSCPAAEQRRRLRERDGLSEEQAAARLAAQMDPAEKRRFAHVVVDTAGTFDETRAVVESLAADLQRVAAERGGPVHIDEDLALACLAGGPAAGPRGLHPLRVLARLAASGLEMQPLARLLDPPCSGPWLQCAREDEGGVGPEALAAPLALWCLGRAGPDHDFVSVASFTLARLTHRAPHELAGACLVAHAQLETLARGGPGPFLRERLDEWESAARARAGAAAPAAARDALLAAAAGGGAEGTVAGALRAAGTPAGPGWDEARAALRALAAPGA